MGNWKQTDPLSEIIDSTDTLYLTYVSVMRYGDVHGRLLIYFFLRRSKGNGVYYFIVIIRYKLLSLLDIRKNLIGLLLLVILAVAVFVKAIIPYPIFSLFSLLLSCLRK
jgi:hypothetical protein